MDLVCTGIHKKEERQVWAWIYELGGHVKMTKPNDEFTENIAAVIVDNLGATDKLVLAIAAGLPILDLSYVRASRDAGEWIHPMDSFDLGDPRFEHKREINKISIPDLHTRRKEKADGGVFRGWNVVILIENSTHRAKLTKQIQIGGGVCIRWTARHLVDATPSDIARITFILTEPIIFDHSDFITFIQTKQDWMRPPIIGYNYVSHYLTKFPRHSVQTFSIFKEEIIRHLCNNLHQEKIDSLLEKSRGLQDVPQPSFSPLSSSGGRHLTNVSQDSQPEFDMVSSFSSPTRMSGSIVPTRQVSQTISNSNLTFESDFTPDEPTDNNDIELLTSPTQIRTNNTNKHHNTSVPGQGYSKTSQNQHDKVSITTQNQSNEMPSASYTSIPTAQEDLDIDEHNSTIDIEVVVSSDEEIQILETDHLASVGGEKSKDGTRKRKRLSGEAAEARKIRELERSWFGKQIKPPVTYLKEPYEAVMDLFYDPDDPILCDRDSAVKYYKDQLIEAYKNRDKLFAKK